MAKYAILLSNILKNVYIDEFILIHGLMFNNYFKTLILKVLIITIADNIFCNNFLHLGYNETKQNQPKLIDHKNNTFILMVGTY